MTSGRRRPKLMRVPDVRRFADEGGRAAVRAALARIRADNEIPPAPDRVGHVDGRRRALDEAVFRALGLDRGETAVLLDALYVGYAAWRAATEDVEHRMRQYRRALTRSGRTRTEDPTEVVARNIVDELSSHRALPAFPADELPPGAPLQQVAVAESFTRPSQDSLFEGGFITAPNGRKVDLGDYERARYTAMLVEIGFRSPVQVPTEAAVCRQVCDSYETAVHRFEAEASRMARQNIPGEAAQEAVQIARRLWRHHCQAAGLNARSVDPMAADGNAA